MPAVTASHKPYSSTYSSSYTSKYMSPSSSSSSSSSSRNYSYRALSLDRPSASTSTTTSSTTRPLSRFTTSSWTSSTSSAGSTFESRYPSTSTSRYSSSLSSRPPRPTESKYQFESLASRKERLGSTSRDVLTSPTSTSSTLSYLRNGGSRFLNNNSYDTKNSSRESSISRDSISDSWRVNRRERSSSRGTTRLDDNDSHGQNHHDSSLSQDSGYNSWGRSSSGKFSPTTSSKYQTVEEEKPRLSISERKAALENLTKRRSVVDSDFTRSSSVTKEDDSNGNRRPSGPSIRERAAQLLDANRNSCDKENEDDARSTSSVSSGSSGTSATTRAKSGLSAKSATQRQFLRNSSPLVNGTCDIDSADASRADDGLSRTFSSKCAVLAKHPYLEGGGQSGLRNIGNTCFMNCIVQCLTYTKPLLEYIIEDKYMSEVSSKSRMEGSIVKSFGSLLTEMWKERESYVNPAHFKKCIAKFAPRFMGYDQQDAQEFLRYLLDGLHEDLNRVITKPKPLDGDMDASLSDSQKADMAWKQYLKFDNSRIVDIFVGQLKSTLTCTVCNHGSVTFDPFWDLSLPLPPNVASDSVSLTDCLALFSKEEVLDGDEKVECSRCKKLVRATKKLTIQRFPKILVLHLKRFGVDRYRGKLTQKVIYPLTDLSLTPYASPGATSSCGKAGLYNLYGVANHVGSLYRGHYTACCKHPYRGEWFEFDDTMVTKVDGTTDLVTSAAYVLFYELSAGSSKHSTRSSSLFSKFIEDAILYHALHLRPAGGCLYEGARAHPFETIHHSDHRETFGAGRPRSEERWRRGRAGAEKKKSRGETSSATTTSEPTMTATSILERSRAKRARMEDVELGKEPNLEEGGLVGLRNLGNTCFMNSVLQCLTKTKPLMDFMLRNQYMHELNEDSFTMGTMIRSFGELMTAMWTDEPYSIYMPLKLKKYVAKLAPRFAGYAQQDAQEFLVYLLEGMHEDVNRSQKKDLPRLPPVRRSLNVRARANEFWRRFKLRENSAIADMFVGQLKSTVQCQECRQSSTTFDPFWDLQLAIPPTEDGNVTLEGCLELFTKAETLEGDERVTCSRCKKRTVSTKWFSIQRFPRVLVIQLKRFYQTAAHQRYKETSRVDFPINFLDLSKFAASTAISPSKYNLYGVCNHIGILQAGHYTACCKHPTKEEWYEYDDSRVSKMFSSVGLVSNKAYLLFYESAPKKIKKPMDPIVKQQQLVVKKKQQQQQRFFAHPRQFVPEVGHLSGDATIIYRLAPKDPPNLGRRSGSRSGHRLEKEILQNPRRSPTSPSSSRVIGPVFPSVRSSPEVLLASQQSNRTEDDVEEEFNSG